MQDRKRIMTVPNVLSAYRIAVAPVTLGMILCNHRTAFATLVISSLVTDVFDGFIARRWHQETDLGAKLDSCADLITYALAMCGMAMFERPFIVAHGLAFGLMISFYIAAQALSLVRFHHLINLHLYTSKGNESPATIDFIQFVLSASGQAVVARLGDVPIP